MKFGTFIKLIYLVHFAEFGVDQSQGLGLVRSQIFELYFCWRSRPIHCIAHAVMGSNVKRTFGPSWRRSITEVLRFGKDIYTLLLLLNWYYRWHVLFADDYDQVWAMARWADLTDLQLVLAICKMPSHHVIRFRCDYTSDELLWHLMMVNSYLQTS